MRPPTPPLHLSPGQRDVLEILARSTSAPHREVQTAKALLLANDGLATTAIAAGWRCPGHGHRLACTLH